MYASKSKEDLVVSINFVLLVINIWYDFDPLISIIFICIMSNINCPFSTKYSYINEITCIQVNYEMRDITASSY